MKVQCLNKASLVIGLVAWIVSSATADVLLVEDANVRRYTDDGTFLGTFAAGLNIPLSVARSEPGGQLFIFDWKGNPCGYEGHLVYSWTWMQSLLLRDPQVRQRVFGVLHE